jgi:hypothetical protein
MRRGIEVQDHHDIAVHRVDSLRAQAIGRVLYLQRTARRGADHQDVLGIGVGAPGGGRREIFDIHPLDLVVEVPRIASGGANHQDYDQAEDSRGPLELAVATTFAGDAPPRVASSPQPPRRGSRSWGASRWRGGRDRCGRGDRRRATRASGGRRRRGFRPPTNGGGHLQDLSTLLAAERGGVEPFDSPLGATARAPDRLGHLSPSPPRGRRAEGPPLRAWPGTGRGR